MIRCSKLLSVLMILGSLAGGAGCVQCPNGEYWCVKGPDPANYLYLETCGPADCEDVKISVPYATIHCLYNNGWPIDALSNCNPALTTGNCLVTVSGCSEIAPAETSVCATLDDCPGYFAYGYDAPPRIEKGGCVWDLTGALGIINADVTAVVNDINNQAGACNPAPPPMAAPSPIVRTDVTWTETNDCTPTSAYKCDETTSSAYRVASSAGWTRRMIVAPATSWVKLQKPGYTTTVPMHGSIVYKPGSLLVGEVFGSSGTFAGASFTPPQFMFPSPAAITGTTTWTLPPSSASAAQLSGWVGGGSPLGLRWGRIYPTGTGVGTFNTGAHTWTYDQTQTSAGIVVTVHLAGTYVDR